MNIERIVIKKNNLYHNGYSHYAHYIGISSTAIAFVNKTDHGYQVFDLEGNGKGLHETRIRAKLAVIEKIINK